MRTSTLIAVLCVALFLAACGQSEPERELPTLIPLDEATEGTIQQLTPTPPAATATPRTRPTLPPSWTPTPQSSPTPQPSTATPAPPIPEAQIDAISEACSVFGPDVANSDDRITVGESPTVAWTPVEGATLYRLYVFDEAGNQLHLWIGAETAYTISADILTREIRYGWEVQPLDAAGIQMCHGRGGLINARD
jgi:hypothetical protein